jgi:hypothetical protein
LSLFVVTNCCPSLSEHPASRTGRRPWGVTRSRKLEVVGGRRLRLKLHHAAFESLRQELQLRRWLRAGSATPPFRRNSNSASSLTAFASPRVTDSKGALNYVTISKIMIIVVGKQPMNRT